MSMALTGTENVHVDVDGGIVTVTIDRGAVNSMSFDMFDQLRMVFHRIAHASGPRVVVLRTAGDRAWIAGNDVTEFVALEFETATASLARVRLAFNAVYDCPIPVIAAIDGAAVGSGLCIASLCDVRLASERAKFALPEIDVGVLGGSKHAMRLAGQGATRLMMYTGRRVSAAEALRLNIVDEVHAADDLFAAAYALAEEIASKSPAAIRLAKQGLNRIEDMPMKAASEFECTLTSESRPSPEATEAAQAWVEHRAPSFAEHRAPTVPALNL